MLWSLIKIVLFFAIVAAIALGATWLLETQGGIRIAVANYEFNLGPLQAAILAVLAIVAVWIVLMLLGLLVATIRFLNGDETAISRYLDRNRERKGYAALNDAILAVAAGDGRTAQARAAKAQRYLDKPEMTTLITAQAAELTGDKRRSEEAYRTLLEDPRTRFIGIRGLLRQKLDEGDTDTAMVLAKHAFTLKPSHEEVQDILLKLQATKHDWAGARATLSEKARRGALPRDVHKRRDAVLALSEAQDVFRDGASIEAREAAIEANKKSPDLIPAAVMASRTLNEAGKEKQAVRVLKKAWEAQPHPDLAAAFAALHPDETPEARLTRFNTLTRISPNDPETRQLVAELNIAAGNFPEARRAISSLVETDPTQRSLALMAAVERGQGADDAVVRGWLARAMTAPRGPQWVCDACQHVHADWTPICDSCGGFDTLAWKRVETTGPTMPGSSDLLPVIVGAPDRSTPPPAEPVRDIPDAEPAEAPKEAQPSP